MPSFFRVLRRTLTTMSQQGDYSVAFVTIDKMEIAKKLAATGREKMQYKTRPGFEPGSPEPLVRGLVKEKHAACVNIIPGLISVYEWEGKINEDPELLLKIKTATSKVDDVIKYVRENHPYDVAEVISFKIDNGNPPYLKWIDEVVGTKPKI
ncbi:protein CutA homolog isoform X1 [Ostrea edulis]|uniref:protein CutA homolog isoform X1 n=1 Tax=Ostrea edulis TaxID=37623 RepID=UPI0020941EA2|nr:protein CutA homolog isoform X1 [Ostrea edulis]